MDEKSAKAKADQQAAVFADFDKMVAHLARVHGLKQPEITQLLSAWTKSKEYRKMKIIDIAHVVGRGYIFIGQHDAAIHIGDKMRYNGQEFNISGIEISSGAKSVGLVLSHSEAAYKIIHKGDEVEIINNN